LNFFVIFGFRKKLFLPFVESNSAGLSKLLSTCPEKIFGENTSLELSVRFISFLATEQKKNQPLVRIVLRGCQKRFLPVRRNFICKDLLRSLFLFSDFERIFSAFCRNFLGRIVRIAFHVSRGKFWQKTHLLKLKKKFMSVLAIEQKISACRWKLFCGVVKTAFLLHKGTFRGTIISIVFCQFGISNECFLAFCRSTKNTFLETSLKIGSFLAVEQNFFGLCQKISGFVVKTAFYLSREKFRQEKISWN